MSGNNETELINILTELRAIQTRLSQDLNAIESRILQIIPEHQTGRQTVENWKEFCDDLRRKKGLI